MFLSISTTHRPATDLGFLLMKHPERVHETDLSFGRAVVFFPTAHEDRCEAALVLDVDPIELVRGRGTSEGLLDQYVNDRPYAASSFLSVAMNRIFRTAMTGVSRERQTLADTAIALEVVVTPLPLRGPDSLLRSLFEPLGWSMDVERIPGHQYSSRYVTLKLRGIVRVADALNHLYVLIPVLDDDKHYWVGDDEVEKLLVKGGSWLPSHPERELIVRRYLKRRRDLVRTALARLAPEEISSESSVASPQQREETIEAPLRLHDQRLDIVVETLAKLGASAVADLGCGEGKLLMRLMGYRQFSKLIGLDASARSLARAAERLKLSQFGSQDNERVKLLHGALTYRDERWYGVDAAVLVEVIEHLDPDRLPALVDIVFGEARPKSIVVTTPNADHNILFPSLDAGTFRHPDHRFEWTRSEMLGWASEIAARHGYSVDVSGIGDVHPEFGAPTQMAVFTR